jgi:hypothetical protein
VIARVLVARARTSNAVLVVGVANSVSANLSESHIFAQGGSALAFLSTKSYGRPPQALAAAIWTPGPSRVHCAAWLNRHRHLRAASQFCVQSELSVAIVTVVGVRFDLLSQFHEGMLSS